MKTVAIVYGTRPEVIKLAPVVHALSQLSNIKTIIVSTGQHTDLLTQTEQSLSMTPSYRLDVGVASHSLEQSFEITLNRVGLLFRDSVKPDLVVVQGDTTTAVAVALACFYMQIPVAHVEAGLRTGDIQSPFPEELNRVLIDKVSTLLFPPTQISADNLTREGLTNWYITGNTIVDAFQSVYPVIETSLDTESHKTAFKTPTHPFLIVTAHRRESHGTPMLGVCNSILRIVDCHSIDVYIPVHPNPQVRTRMQDMFKNHKKVHLLPPLSYIEFLRLLSNCKFILSDSGGVQEEAALVHKPILILRDRTERPEIVSCGIGRLVGTDENRIFQAATELLTDQVKYEAMCKAPNPLGDGLAAIRITSSIAKFLFPKENHP